MDMLKEYYRFLDEQIARGTKLWQITIIGTDGSTPAQQGMRMIVPDNDKEYGNLGGGEMEYNIVNQVRRLRPDSPLRLTFTLYQKESAQQIIFEDQEIIDTSMVCGGKVEVFIEPLFLKDSLYIFGGGHCGRALCHLAKLVDFKITILDNRSELLCPELLPQADQLICTDYTDVIKYINPGDNNYIVIMTHGHLHDKQVLEQCLAIPCRYLGMIGSKTKVDETKGKLLEKGYTLDQLNAIHAPIGIPIASHTPYEIAVSIIAELIQIRNKKVD